MNLFSTAPNKDKMNAAPRFTRIEAANHRCQESEQFGARLSKRGLGAPVRSIGAEIGKVDLLEYDCQSRSAIDAVAVTTALFDNRKE